MEKVTENPVKVATELILEQPTFRMCVLQVNQPQPTQLKENITGSQELLNSNERSGLTKAKENMRDQHVISVGFVSEWSRKKNFFLFLSYFALFFVLWFFLLHRAYVEPNQTILGFLSKRNRKPL